MKMIIKVMMIKVIIKVMMQMIMTTMMKMIMKARTHDGDEDNPTE